MSSDNIRDQPGKALTETEKTIIHTLAREGPRSGYDFHLGGHKQRSGRTALMSSETWQIHSRILVGRNLIELVSYPARFSEDDERGRRRDVYWLTEGGIAQAVAQSEPLGLLENWVKRVRPPSQVERQKAGLTLIEIAREAGPDLFAWAFVPPPIDEERLKKFVGVLSRHPEYFEKLKETNPLLVDSLVKFAKGIQS